MTRLIALLAVLAAVALACGGGAPAGGGSAPKPAAAAAKKGAASSADAGTSTGIVSLVPYLYNPVAKRDPFRNLLEDAKGSNGTEKTEGLCNDPLCGFDLDQLTLVAVVSGDANPVGMLEDPSKTGHVIHRNSRVGKQGGKVTQIQRDCVVVTEYFQTPDGKVNPNRVNLCIKQDKRSVPVLDLLQNKLFEPQ